MEPSACRAWPTGSGWSGGLTRAPAGQLNIYGFLSIFLLDFLSIFYHIYWLFLMIFQFSTAPSLGADTHVTCMVFYCPLVACCGAGPWHEGKFFSIAQPAKCILHACWSVLLALILAPCAQKTAWGLFLCFPCTVLHVSFICLYFLFIFPVTASSFI